MDRFIGRMLGNRYELIEKIGEGGMAYVYKGKCHLLNRLVAVKVLRPEFIQDEEFVAKFEHESQAAASLSHHNIVNVYDIGIESDIRYIVMELVEGKTLKEYIREQKDFLPNNKIMDISIQIARALQHAHENHIIHRDIKPHNILIDKRGMVKVADFGIARAITSSTRVNAKELIGSVHYTSPEQARGGFVDSRSDLYSLGVLMYELATKRLPFEGDTHISIALKHLKEPALTPTNINPELNQGLQNIILKALQKDVNLRYQSAKEIIDDIQMVIDKPNEQMEFYIPDEESPTVILPNVEEFLNASEEKNNRYKEEHKSRNKFVIVLVVFLALLITAGGFVYLGYNSIKNNLRSSVVTVPDLHNQPYEEAMNTLQGLGLYADISEKKFDRDVAKGHIISQSVEANTSVKEGFTISLIVSKGTITSKVPNLLQKELSEAQLMLQNNKLSLGDVKYVNNELPKGYVLRQNPKPGTNAPQNSLVDLVVSEGKKIESVILPSILGKTLDDAKVTLSPLHIYISNTSYNYSNEYPADTIMSQSRRGGMEVKEGTYIDVVISKGSESGNTSAPSEGEGESNLAPSGETNSNTVINDSDLVEKPYFITPDFDEDSKVIRVDLVQNGITKTVYKKRHNRSNESIRVIVKAKGEATVNFYFDDELVRSKSEKFE